MGANLDTSQLDDTNLARLIVIIQKKEIVSKEERQRERQWGSPANWADSVKSVLVANAWRKGAVCFGEHREKLQNLT